MGTEAVAADETAEALIAVSADTELKKRVGVLERNAADVNSRVASMETLIRGQSVASLLEFAKVRGQEKPLGLRSRVEKLKVNINDLKRRVQSLEVDVTGLIQESAGPLPTHRQLGN